MKKYGDFSLITQKALRFKAVAGATKLKLLPQPWPQDQLPPNTASLLSIASTRGLVAAAGPDSLVITTTRDVQQGYIAPIPAEDDVKPLTPQIVIPIQRLSHVAFSADESCLVVAAEIGGGFNVYDVETLLKGNHNPAFQLATNNTAVRALVPNPAPGLAHLFAVILADGNLIVANMIDKQISRVFKDGVTCLSWSAKGKQLVAGLKTGTAVQYDPQGNEKAVIPRPENLVPSLPMASICWITNDEFLTIHDPPPDGDAGSIYHIISRQSQSGSFTSRNFADSSYTCPAFGPRIPAHHYISRLRQFPPNLDEILILSSSASEEISLITRASVSLAGASQSGDGNPEANTVNTFTATNMAEDTDRAQLPYSNTRGADTSPIGMAMDLSCQDTVIKPIRGDELDESATPLPALMVLNEEGILSTWWIIYIDSIRQKLAYPGLVAAKPASSAQPTLAAPSNTTSAFGTSAPSQPTQPALAATGMGQSSQPAFSTAGSSKPTPSFGSPSTPGTFGGASALGSKPSPWAATKSSGVGAPQASGQPTFGSSTPIGGASGTFGAANPLGNKSSLWGVPAGGQTPSATFGKPSTAFGGSSATSGASGFAALAANSPDKPAFASGSNQPGLGSPFPSFGNTSQASASPFANFAANNDKKTSGLAAFGQNSDKPNSTPQQSFGSTVTLPSTTGGSFGAASTIGAKPSLWGSPAPTQSSPAPASKDEAMSDDDDDDVGKSSQETAKPQDSNSASLSDQPSKAAPVSPFAQFGQSSKTAVSPFAHVGQTSKSAESPFAKFGQTSKSTESPESPFSKLGAQTSTPSPFLQSSDKSKTSIFSMNSGKSAPSVFGKPSEKPSGLGSFSGFQLGSTFQRDDSAKDDLPPSKDAGKQMFGAGFGNMLGEAAKDAPKEPETPVKKEPGTDEPKLHDISTTPAAAAEQSEAEDAVEAEDAPLPPDFTTFTAKPVEDDLPPIAGSPPVDLGDTSQLSSNVSEEDEEEDGEQDDEEGESEDIDRSSRDEDDESWVDEGGDDRTDDDEEEGPDQDDTVSRPPMTSAANSFGSRLKFPPKPIERKEQVTIPSTTPAGFPKAPHFPAPNKQTSPRSPSPVRPLDRSVGAPPSRSTSRQSTSKQPLTVPPLPAWANSRPSSSAPKPPPQATEPEAGELSDDEDARIQEILREPVGPSKTLEPFVAHQDYLGQTTKPGIGGQIEKVYRDINSMIDTLGLNVRSLQSFVKGHEELCKSERERSDLEDPEDWCLVETDSLGVVEKNLGDDLNSGKVEDVKSKLDELTELYKKSANLRTRTADMRKQIATREDPQQRAVHRAAALSTEVQMQQTEIRQGVSKVQKLLQEAEEALSVLRADLASVPSTNQNTQRVPTVEAVTNTIMKMTAMIEQKSGDVDVLEAQIKRLPQGLAGLSLEDESPNFMRSSVRSLNGHGANPFLATPPRSRALPRSTTQPQLGMSGMFGSSRFQTPQMARKSQSTYGFGYTPDESVDLRSSVRSLNGSTRKKMSDVSSEEVKRYLAKQDQRRKVVAALKETVEKRGTRVTKAEK